MYERYLTPRQAALLQRGVNLTLRALAAWAFTFGMVVPLERIEWEAYEVSVSGTRGHDV
ncbi:hypothetical protein VMT65_03080 [Nocardia sp. CDC153]|uniref:hypothetical protein n=1 Tax=Nocardia sp. CDC153 TaxID=3112167 RepID=UPI002DBB593E|nr:hypothetical protein [Nocardia sp. CDC153]MEC3952009.1 hypothetical protein [Nocardia sp. CDC153]